MFKKDYDSPRFRGGGIYAIVNRTKARVYVWQSENIKSRALQHKNDLQKGKHPCRDLQTDFLNGNNIEFIVLHRLADSENTKFMRNILEKAYIIGFCRNEFVLYNTVVVDENGGAEKAEKFLISDILFNYHVYDNITDAYKEKFNIFHFNDCISRKYQEAHKEKY